MHLDPPVATDPVVHLVDDDGAVRESLSFLLDSAGLEVRTYASAESFLEASEAGVSGCVVTDVRMEQMSGLDLVRRLNQRGVGLPVIMITGHGDVPMAVEAMKEGVIDFLEKPFDQDVFLGAVRAAMTHLERGHADDAERRKAQARLAALSPREAEVLRRVVAGKANKEIARDLGISPRTVEVYRANVMTKTGADSLSDLVRMALLAGA